MLCIFVFLPYATITACLVRFAPSMKVILHFPRPCEKAPGEAAKLTSGGLGLIFEGHMPQEAPNMQYPLSWTHRAFLSPFLGRVQNPALHFLSVPTISIISSPPFSCRQHCLQPASLLLHSGLKGTRGRKRLLPPEIESPFPHLKQENG